MPTNHLKEITYPSGRVLIYSPGRAANFRDHPQGSHHILACSPGWPVFSSFSSIIDVKKNDLPLYISWKWKSELFDTLLKGV
jgi:hypothetical protein